MSAFTPGAAFAVGFGFGVMVAALAAVVVAILFLEDLAALRRAERRAMDDLRARLPW